VLNAGEKLLEQTEMPSKFYFKKETPKALGGLKIGLRKLVVVTGASSGLGLTAASTLAKSGRYFVIMACRDIEKAEKGEYNKLKCIELVLPLTVLIYSPGFVASLFGLFIIQWRRNQGCLTGRILS